MNNENDNQQQATEIGAKLLDKANDIGEFCSKDSARFVLQGIHLTKDGVEATDGRVAIRVPYSGISTEEFPPTKTPETLSESILPVKALREALKTISPKAVLPVLQTVKVASNGDGKIQLATTDLENDRVLSVKPIDGTFPLLQNLWPTEEPKFSVTLNADLLATIAEYAMKHGKLLKGRSPEHAVRFDFTDNLSVVKFSLMLEDGRKAEGVLMPMRMS